jgi:hypothetical protein
VVRSRSLITSTPSLVTPEAVAEFDCDTVVEVEVMERFAVGGRSGGEYWVPTSTEVDLPARLRSSSTSTTRRLVGAKVGVCCSVLELWTDVAGLDAWLRKACDEEGDRRYDERCEPDRLSELAYDGRSWAQAAEAAIFGESVGEGELSTLIAATFSCGAACAAESCLGGSLYQKLGCHLSKPVSVQENPLRMRRPIFSPLCSHC